MNWFPTTVDRKVRIAAWTTFVVQILIVVTGGAVRLTASGLGCPTWPTCTEDSLVNTPEMGIHGIIEFGNRLLTFLLVIVAIVTFALVFRMRKNRRDFFWLTLLIGLGIPAQAVIGGISVLMQLNPYVVGLHFIVSIVMVVAYHKVNEYGQSVASLGRVDPALALWGPFALFSALIGWMYWRVAYVPGGQPIGALEKFFSNLGKRIAALWKRRRRQARTA